MEENQLTCLLICLLLHSSEDLENREHVLQANLLLQAIIMEKFSLVYLLYQGCQISLVTINANWEKYTK
jgi:hypothetical protein